MSTKEMFSAISGNWLCDKVATGQDYVQDSNFLVCFNGTMLGFQSVSGIGQSIDREYIVEGGRNDCPISLRVGRKQPYQLTFLRGYIINRVSVNTAIGMDIFTSDAIYEEGLGAIFILDSEKYIAGCYYFYSNGVMEWTLSDLNAQSPQRLIETFTVSHNGLYSVPVPYYTNITNILLGNAM